MHPPSINTQTRWNSLLAPKVNILVWRVRMDKLFTLINLDYKAKDILIPSILFIIWKLSNFLIFYSKMKWQLEHGMKFLNGWGWKMFNLLQLIIFLITWTLFIVEPIRRMQLMLWWGRLCVIYGYFIMIMFSLKESWKKGILLIPFVNFQFMVF